MSYMGGGKTPSDRQQLTCALLTVLGVVVAVILAYTLPHIICGNLGAGCPHP